jgi:hypothetical protein
MAAHHGEQRAIRPEMDLWQIEVPVLHPCRGAMPVPKFTTSSLRRRTFLMKP